MVQLFGGEIAGEAGDGLTAIAEYNRTKPDIVLMDITMPQMKVSKRSNALCGNIPRHAS